MTAKELFTKAYRRALVATGAALDTAYLEECWRAVAAFPASLFDAAASRLIGSSLWLPKPAEWVQVCTDLRAEGYQEEARAREREADALRSGRDYHCLVCRDTGFAPGRCTDAAWCGRCRLKSQHLYDHDFVRPCSCRSTNPVWQAELARKQEAAGRLTAASRGDRGRAA